MVTLCRYACGPQPYPSSSTAEKQMVIYTKCKKPFVFLWPCVAKDLKGSDYTSIKERIESPITWLSEFGKGGKDLPFYLSSYINLVDESGRCLRGDKRGIISQSTAKTIDEIGIEPDTWLDELKGFKSIGFSAVGTTEQLKQYSKKTKRKWTLGNKLKPALE